MSCFASNITQEKSKKRVDFIMVSFPVFESPVKVPVVAKKEKRKRSKDTRRSASKKAKMEKNALVETVETLKEE